MLKYGGCASFTVITTAHQTSTVSFTNYVPRVVMDEVPEVINNDSLMVFSLFIAI